MIKRIVCVLLALVMLAAAGCESSAARPVTNSDSEAERSYIYDSFTQPEVGIGSEVFAADSVLCAASFGGVVGRRMDNLMNNWMYTAYYANPYMLEAFRQRDSVMSRQLMAWYGEFPGKYLTSVALMYSMNRDGNLRTVGDELTAALAEVQDDDGYLGVFSREDRMLGASEMDINGSVLSTSNWDMWNHYHIIRGLLLWYGQTGSQTAYDTAVKAADYIIEYFSGDHNLSQVMEADKNLSILPVYVKLYNLTGEQRYVDFANAILKAWQGGNGGDFINQALAGTPYSMLPQSRWETMHSLLGIADVYELTGDERFRTAFLNLFESLRTDDRHNSGGMMNSEKAVGSPYASGGIETCATVAWVECCARALELTGDSAIADELELATLNAVLGSQSPSGRWFTYNTPDAGIRLCSATELNFQSEPGSPELNCCAVSGPSGLGLVSEWAVTADEAALSLNYYGQSAIAAHTPSGGAVVLSQQTEYPTAGNVAITVAMQSEEEFTLRLRIPAWSANTTVTVGGESYPAEAGSYCEITRRWSDGDVIALELDMAVHYWVGEKNRDGCASVYYGPLLLTYDERYNDAFKCVDLPQLDLASMTLTAVGNTVVPGAPEPIVLFRADFADGTSVTLCDFATAGHAGTDYTSWLPAADLSGYSVEAAGSEWLAVRKGA